jgi:hypothetical protein
MGGLLLLSQSDCAAMDLSHRLERPFQADLGRFEGLAQGLSGPMEAVGADSGRFGAFQAGQKRLSSARMPV